MMIEYRVKWLIIDGGIGQSVVGLLLLLRYASFLFLSQSCGHNIHLFIRLLGCVKMKKATFSIRVGIVTFAIIAFGIVE